MNNDIASKILEQKQSDKSEDQLFMENQYKELLQHCILFGLSKVQFFDHAAFHGGTCLRIVDRIDRFSEDLDFIKTNPETSSADLARLIDDAKKFLSSNGLELEITHNKINNNVQKLWIKEGALAKIFLDKNPKYVLQDAKSNVKLELDTNPPSGSTLKKVTLNFPERFEIAIQDHESSFAGKLHAVLCRDFLNGGTEYIKGRDYFDLDWYLSQKVQPNYELLKNALKKSGPFADQDLKIDNQWLLKQLDSKLQSLNWTLAKQDMTNFLLEAPLESLDDIFNYESMRRKMKASLT